MVTKTMKWPIQMIEVPENWVHKSNEMLITGDAAHAMLPYMALGM
jgi:salicylate hydroxylase